LCQVLEVGLGLDPLRWVSERLGMGHFTVVSQAISQVRRRPARRHGTNHALTEQTRSNRAQAWRG
jgi:hypothetical protein